MANLQLNTGPTTEVGKQPSPFEHWTRLLYMLGFSLLMVGVIYFFAANWPVLPRVWKIALSISLTVCFYALGLIIQYTLTASRHYFVRWMMFLGCISFGISVALLGQIYNSHADSYSLFLVWFVVAFLFSLTTRFVPIDLLSYTLLHLTVWFFFFPTSYQFYHTDILRFTVFLAVALFNALLVLSVERRWIESQLLKYISFVMLHGILIYLSNSNAFSFSGWVVGIMNVLYLLVLALSVLFFVRKRNDRPLFILTGLMTFMFTVTKFFEVLSHFFGDVLENVFVLTLLFVVLLVLANVYVVRWLRKKERSAAEATRWGVFLRRALVMLVSVIATFLGAFALIGLTALTVDEILFETLFIFAALGLLAAALLRKLESSVRFPLLGIALIVGLSTALSEALLLFALYQLLLVFTWYRTDNEAMKNLAHTALGLVWLLYFLYSGWSFETYLLVFTLLHALFYLLNLALKSRVTSGLGSISIVYFLLGFMALTLVRSDWDVWHTFYNIAFFVLTTALLFWFQRRGEKFAYRLTLTFWFLFLAFKYYDFVWTLLHKSVALLLLGLLFLAVAYMADRRRESAHGETAATSFVLPRKWLLIALVLLQLAWLGWQVASSERLLAQGQEVKLELQPIDPRSLLQGDYVILRYEISNLREEAWQAYDKVQLVLRADEDGVYRYTGVYRLGGEYNRPYEPQPHDVLITGRYDGYSGLQFGIESYFVPEGTGLEWEREARYAYVRVASNGNALLTHLEKGEEPTLPRQR